IPYLRERHEEYLNLVAGNEIFINRTKGVGKYDAKTAVQYGLSGQCLRCTGIQRDLRKDQPYSIYDRFDFDVPIATEGDCYDRFQVRMEEIRQSLRIIEQAVEQIPEGPIMAKVPRLIRPPEGEVYTAVENPRGELGVHLISQGKPNPWRIHWRGPSFHNLQALPQPSDAEGIGNSNALRGAVGSPRGELGVHLNSKGKANPWRIHWRRPSFHNLQILPQLLEGENIANVIAILGAVDIVLGDVDG